MGTKAKRRGNGEGSITQLKNGSFRLRVCIGKKEDGKKEFKEFSGSTEKIVRDKYEAYKIERAMGFVGERVPTLKEYAIRWMEDVKMIELKPSSYDRLESTFTNHIIPKLGHTKLNALTAQQIQRELINKMQKDGLSYSSIKKAYDGINAVCKYAFDDGKLQRNPVALVKMPSKAESKQKEVVYFDREEREAIIAACKQEYGNGNRRYTFGSAYILCMYTGLRMAEILALRWDQVNWEKKRITVTDSVVLVKDRDNVDSGGHIHRTLLVQNTTKTAAKRDVPLSRFAYEALLDLKEQTPYDEHGFVVCTHVGVPISPGHFGKTFSKILDNAAVKQAGVHALRHTYATMLFERGIDVRIISSLLGHSSTAVTYSVYIHFSNRLMQETVNALQDIT